MIHYFQNFMTYFTSPITFPQSILIDLKQQFIIMKNQFIPQFNSQFYLQYHILMRNP